FSQTKRGQMTWSISLSALTTQKDCLVSQRHRNHELNNFLFNSCLSLEVEISKTQIHSHNGLLPSSSLYGICKAVSKRKLIEKTEGFERGENAEYRFISEINNPEVYKSIGAKKILTKLFLRGLLCALVSEKTVCILYQCSQKYSKIHKKRHAVTLYKVRSQRENCGIVTTRKGNRKIHYYLLRTPVKDIRLHIKAQHLKKEIEGTKSSGGPDPKLKSYKA
ncbi:hypothetical protein N307_11160, partial [Dryobates pubescens]